jgi:TonB-dependent receptor
MLKIQGTIAPSWRRQALMLSGASVLALAAAGPAWAQSAPPPPTPTSAGGSDEQPTEKKGASAVGEVVITGIRQSLQNAQAIKRNADVFVDSVTAEDIGALPDRSVTEALQRIPGVDIDRFASGRDPDHFSVEGNGVVVRGLTFTRSEFNGRDSFSANNGRGLNFQDVPAELMGGVDVFKNQSADMIEGGIAGTINLRTRVPFDSAGRVISISAEDSYADFAKKSAPTGSIFFSDRWDTDVGEFGLMLDAVRSELFSRADGQQISNFGQRWLDASGNLLPSTATTGARQVWVPRGAALREDDFDHTRTGFGAAAQWRSPDHTMLATFQFLRSQATEAWTEHAIEIATDVVTGNGDSQAVDGTNLTFDNEGVFTSGTITGPTGWRADQFNADPRTPINGLQSNNIARDVLQTNTVDDFGANLKWTPNDRWSFNFDFQHTTAKVDDLDVSMITSSYQNVDIKLRGSDIPVVTFLPPSLNGVVPVCNPPSQNCPNYFNAPHASFADPFNTFNRAAMDHIEHSDGYENAFRADGEYKIGDDFITAFKFGYRYSDRNETTRYSAYNWGVTSEQWGNNGPIWLDQSINGTPLASQYAPFVFSNFMGGAVPSPTGSEGRLFYTGNMVTNYKQFAAFALAYAQAWQATGGFVPLADRPGVVPGTPFLPSEINPSDEKTNSVYGMFKYDHRLDNGIEISGNIGVRYFKTDRVSDGFASFLTVSYPTDAQCAAVPIGQTPPPFCQLSATTRQQARNFANGAAIADNAKTSYDFWLPSWNMKVDIGGGKLFRFGISKAESPPDIGLTRNFFPIGLGGNDVTTIVNGQPEFTATAGNPLLKPQWSWNYDASFEYYFAKVGQITVSVFYKELHDVITNGTVRDSFTNNGATFSGIVTSPINASDIGKVKGFEVAYQQLYNTLPAPFDGLGLNANYTFVDSDGVKQSTLSNTDPDVAAGTVANIDTSKLPLQGLSQNTFNISPFYEKGPFSARLAYNWRSRYLLTTRDVIVPFAPIMQEDYGTLDGSFFYTLTPHVKIGVQGVNLTNSITRTSSVLAVSPSLLTAPRSWFMTDRRVTFIVRGTW